MKRLLHVGCGPRTKSDTTAGFRSEIWTEVRLDVDPAVAPEIIGSMTDMSSVDNESVDAIFSSHNIEHLYPHEVPIALSEFVRVLKPDGFIVLTCPDLQAVCAMVAEDKLTDVAYESPAGPISPVDMLYGYRPAMALGNLYMAHRCGFTEKVLSATLRVAGLPCVGTIRRPLAFDLWVVACKSVVPDEVLMRLAEEHFPG